MMRYSLPASSSNLCFQSILDSMKLYKGQKEFCDIIFVQYYCALWALCHGNNENAEVLASSSTFLTYWLESVETSIATDAPSLILVVLGACNAVFVKRSERRAKLMQVCETAETTTILTRVIDILKGFRDLKVFLPLKVLNSIAALLDIVKVHL